MEGESLCGIVDTFAPEDNLIETPKRVTEGSVYRTIATVEQKSPKIYGVGLKQLELVELQRRT